MRIRESVKSAFVQSCVISSALPDSKKEVTYIHIYLSYYLLRTRVSTVRVKRELMTVCLCSEMYDVVSFAR